MDFRQDSVAAYEQMQAGIDLSSNRCAERSNGEGAYIPPWYILAGLKGLGRSPVCNTLAIFECLSIANVGVDRFRDWRRRRKLGDEGQPAFENRVNAEARKFRRSPRTTDELRFELWCEIRKRLGLRPALPLSTGSANARSAEVGSCAARHYKQEGYGDRTERPRDFGGLVRQQVRKVVFAALKGEGLSAAQRQTVEGEFLRGLEQLPDDLRDSSLERAIHSGNWEVAASLVSAGSLAGLGVAVEVAGFGAYITAAKASAIIPFLGGQAAVSTLAVVSNPLFIVPVTTCVLVVMNMKLKGRVLRPVASKAAVQLAVLGLATRANGLQQCLDAFKRLPPGDRDWDLWRRRQQVSRMVDGIPRTPGRPNVILPSIADAGLGDTLTSVLFPRRKGVGVEAAVAAGMATADLLFDMAAIDPRVVAAADFSRSENLGDIFRFGAFADRIKSMDEAARTGAESGLQGYFAEMVVATRLQGHEIRLPDTANNPGIDLIVDGHPFQVKCYGDSSAAMSALREHFAKYPDIPVYVNSEVLPTVHNSGEPWAESVFGVEGFDYETTNQVLGESVAAGADLSDLNIPMFAIAASAARNMHGWWKGSVPLSDLPSEIIIDGTVHGGLSVAGGFSGAALGGLVFGPAGAVVFGGVGGIASLFGAPKSRRIVRRIAYRKRSRSVKESVTRFEAVLRHTMKKKIERKRNRIDVMESKIERLRLELDRRAAESAVVAEVNRPPEPIRIWRRVWNRLAAPFVQSNREPAGLSVKRRETPNEVVARWMRLKFEDQILCVAECRVEMGYLPRDPYERTRELMRLMREAGVHPLSVKKELKSLLIALSKWRG